MNKLMIVLGLGSVLVACSEKEEDTAGEDIAVTEEDTAVSEEETAEDAETDEPVEDSSIDECDLIDIEVTEVALPSSAEEAAQLILIPDVGESYHLIKESGAEGWFVLEVPSWMCDVELYTTEAISIELETSPDWELGDVATPVSECEDSGLNRHSWTFHAWGSYVVHIEGTDSTGLWLGIRMVSAGPG